MNRSSPGPGPDQDYDRFRRILTGRRLPAAIVDLDALEHNVRLTRSAVESAPRPPDRPPLTLRPATKSIRHVGLIRRIQELGGACFQGLMCFSVEEALALHEAGFDDLLIAYPTTQPAALAAAAKAVAAAAAEDGALIRFVVDHPAHLEALATAARTQPDGAQLRAVIELDTSYRRAGGRIHAGARRSPVRSPEDAVALAAHAPPGDGPVRIDGVMAYEAHIAGVPDDHPAGRAMSAGIAALKRLAIPDTRRLRAATAAALTAAGHTLTLINGGGSGSLTSTPADPAVTEVTAGSGFLMPHLFDRFTALRAHRPAIFFALEACRAPDPGVLTLQGGGYVASGEPGPDKLPAPHSPAAKLLPMEGAGEVQTPVRLPPSAAAPKIGDAVILRHAKAGELAERFASYLLVRGSDAIAEEPTYRGEGWTFY